MRKIRLLAVVTTSLLAAGCSREEALLLAMETGLTEQFEVACAGNATCIQTVASSADECFDPQLARAAIGAPAETQKRVNTQQIVAMQACLAKAAGRDFWHGLDMPRRILEQVGQGS
jgi:hypothetical protein